MASTHDPTAPTGPAAKPVTLSMYPSVAAALNVTTDPPDQAAVRVATVCAKAGLWLTEIRWVLCYNRADLLAEVRRAPSDIAEDAWSNGPQNGPGGSGKTSSSKAPGTAAAPGTTLLDSLSVNGEWLDQQKFSELEYAVDGMITEGLGLLVAPPKKGKSFFAADVGLAVAAGRLALGVIQVTKRPVLYLALEDGHRRLQSRFRRILVGGHIPKGITLVTKAAPAEAITAIEEFFTRHKKAKPLVILDTLGKVKPPKQRNEDQYQADYRLGGQLKDLVDAVPGATLLVVHHTRKAEASDFVDSVSGTNGVAGSVDFVLALDRKRLSNDAILSVTGRDILEAEYALKAQDGILWRLDGADLKAAADMVTKRRATDKLGDRSLEVLRFVENKPPFTTITATDVATALGGMDGSLAGQYLRRLADQGLILKSGRGQYQPATPTTP